MRVALGINTERTDQRAAAPRGPFIVGYFARIAPEKGLHALAAGYRASRSRPALGPSRLVVAGLSCTRAP